MAETNKPHYYVEYLVEEYSPPVMMAGQLQMFLNRYAEDGWRLVAIKVDLFIFERAVFFEGNGNDVLGT